MATFTYRARNEAGKVVKGVLEAPSREDVGVRLRKLGYLVSGVEETLGSGFGLDGFSDGFGRVKAQDIVMFNFQLANMLGAGLSILMSLKILGQQFEKSKLKKVIGDVSRNVEAGISFSEALAMHPNVFSKLIVQSVRAGEASGHLDTVLQRLATYTEAQEELRQKIQGALFYPTILFVAGISVILLVVSFLIPQFVAIFNEAGVSLPIQTRILHVVGMGIRDHGYLWLTGVALVVILWRWMIRTRWGERCYHAFSLKVPVVGSLLRKLCISRFARTLATLTASGVPILTSLDLVGEVVGNRIIAQALHQARQAVESGAKLAQPLKVSGEFPMDTVQMIAVGEETGDLDEMLDKISDYYDRAVTYGVKRLTQLIEPLFLILMGLMVGFIMASVLFPIFDLATTLKH